LGIFVDKKSQNDQTPFPEVGRKPPGFTTYRSTLNIHFVDKVKKSYCFETLSHVHVYRIKYVNVSFRQGPYRMHIISAADRVWVTGKFFCETHIFEDIV